MPKLISCQITHKKMKQTSIHNVKISELFCHSEFTWNHVLLQLNDNNCLASNHWNYKKPLKSSSLGLFIFLCTKLISRKIWAIEEFSNFHTVFYECASCTRFLSGSEQTWPQALPEVAWFLFRLFPHLHPSQKSHSWYRNSTFL